MSVWHVIPCNDLREHELSPKCWCKPTQSDEEPAMWIYHSLDGRLRRLETEQTEKSDG